MCDIIVAFFHSAAGQCGFETLHLPNKGNPWEKKFYVIQHMHQVEVHTGVHIGLIGRCTKLLISYTVYTVEWSVFKLNSYGTFEYDP